MIPLDIRFKNYRKRQKQVRTKTPSDSYIQDFTSKVLKLKPMKVKKADLKGLLTKKYNPFELRRGIKLV